MQIEKIPPPLLAFNENVRVKQCGDILEIRHMKHSHKSNIQKLDAATYVHTETGEVKEYKKKSLSRADDLISVSKSLRRLRDIINTNVTDTKKCLWVTLTYKQNMTDPQKLYSDFKQYIARFRYWLDKNHPGMTAEYTVAIEPQGRGAWHAHVILLFNAKAPFIENQTMQRLWGHGFTSTAKLTDCDNVGAYLSAYLGDMSLADAVEQSTLTQTVKEVVTTDSQGDKSSKYYIKGARLKMYPSHFKIYRCSRGIKQPAITTMTNYEAMQLSRGAALTFEKTIRLLDDDGKEINVINYRHYNKRRKKVI